MGCMASTPAPPVATSGSSHSSGSREGGSGAPRGRGGHTGAPRSGGGHGGGSGPWVMEGGPVTLSQLALKRQTFWETAHATGHATVWQNLHLAADALLEGNAELAMTVLEAADIRCANGGTDLSFVYDSTGNSYRLERWVFSNPTNIVSDADMAKISHSNRKTHVGPVLDLTLTIRISPSTTSSEQDVRLTVKSNHTGEQVKRALHEALLSGAHDQVPDASNPRVNKWAGKGLPPVRQRLLYRGRLIDDDVHMQEAGVASGTIVQVFIRHEA